MKKSIINLVKVLKNKLVEFPVMVNRLERKDPHFTNKLMEWIKSTEELLATYNISETSELAGIRSKIIAPAFDTTTRRASMKKEQLRVAAAVLYELQHLLLEVLQPYEMKVEESRELVRQLLLIVGQSGAISYDTSIPFDVFFNQVWSFINANDQLKAGAVKLKTSLPFNDIQLLIAEEIDLTAFQNHETGAE